MPPSVLNGATAALFGSLSRIRGKRILHPDGIAFSATFIADPQPTLGARLFASATERPAIVRLSPALSLPPGLPDFGGAAIRVLDAYGEHLHQDLLLVTSGRRPVTRHLLRPAQGFAGQWYSSLLPYRIGEQTLIIGARADNAEPPGTLRIELAAPRGAWVDAATVRLDEQLSAEASAELAFSVEHCGGGIEPVGFINSLRPPAYRGSQLGRALPGERARRQQLATAAHDSFDLTA